MKVRFPLITMICVYFVLSSPAACLFAGEIEGKVVSKISRFRANAVVYLAKIPGKDFAPPEKSVSMDQRNMKFIPHVLPVLKGTTVDFLNSDNMVHNVFTPDEVADKFNLGTWPQGEFRSFTFAKPGNAVMLCKVHPEMEAWVVVLETPYFALSDKSGAFKIENVPAGEYTLEVWHEKRKGDSQKISVSDQGSVSVEITLKR